jgi:hypothetical protein
MGLPKASLHACCDLGLQPKQGTAWGASCKEPNRWASLYICVIWADGDDARTQGVAGESGICSRLSPQPWDPCLLDSTCCGDNLHVAAALDVK